MLVAKLGPEVRTYVELLAAIAALLEFLGVKTFARNALRDRRVRGIVALRVPLFLVLVLALASGDVHGAALKTLVAVALVAGGVGDALLRWIRLAWNRLFPKQRLPVETQVGIARLAGMVDGAVVQDHFRDSREAKRLADKLGEIVAIPHPATAMATYRAGAAESTHMKIFLLIKRLIANKSYQPDSNDLLNRFYNNPEDVSQLEAMQNGLYAIATDLGTKATELIRKK